MPARKMRVEVFDESGNRYTISFDGRVTRDKALRVLDMVELLGGMPSDDAELNPNHEASKFDKVQLVLERHFPLVWFSAKDVQPLYQKEAGEPITLSTVSTYLSRIADRGALMKTRNSNRVLFKLVSKGVKKILEVPRALA